MFTSSGFLKLSGAVLSPCLSGFLCHCAQGQQQTWPTQLENLFLNTACARACACVGHSWLLLYLKGGLPWSVKTTRAALQRAESRQSRCNRNMPSSCNHVSHKRLTGLLRTWTRGLTVPEGIEVSRQGTLGALAERGATQGRYCHDQGPQQLRRPCRCKRTYSTETHLEVITERSDLLLAHRKSLPRGRLRSIFEWRGFAPAGENANTAQEAVPRADPGSDCCFAEQQSGHGCVMLGEQKYFVVIRRREAERL